MEGLIDGIASSPDMQKKYLVTIKQKAEELEHLISQLFFFSKMELDEFPVHAELCNLAETVHRVINSYRSEYREENCIITERLSDTYVYADNDLITRVCRNIIENSVKYRKKAVVHIEVSITGEEGYALLTLRDDGPGVPVEEVTDLFTVFYRCDRSRKNTADGSGLGLAIAAKAVERMGGTIDARNIQPCGLSVCVRLPEAHTETDKEKKT